MKRSLFFFFLLFAVLQINAQSFTVSLNGGYAGAGFFNTENVMGPGINPATPQVDALVPMANINDSAHTYKPVHGSYGAGGNVTLGLGCEINRYVEVGLGIAYSHSNTISCDQVRQLTGQGGAVPFILTPYYLNANISTFSYAVAVLPSITINGAKPGWKIYPYTRIGLTLPVAGIVKHNMSIAVDTGIDVFLHTSPFFLGTQNAVQLQTTAIVSLGFNAAVGVTYKPLPFMSVSLEINGQLLNVRAKSSTITEWNSTYIDSSGKTVTVNQLPARGTYRTQFTFVDQLTAQSNNQYYNNNVNQPNPNYNPNLPKNDIRPIAPASNIGFNVSIKFYIGKGTLGKKKDKDKPAAVKS
jgi:hypothetical protein